MLDLRQSGPDVLLPVSVQARASRTALAGVHGEALKLQLTAPPVEGAANEACLRLLAEILGISRARLAIVKGSRARQKLIRIANASLVEVRARLESLLPRG